MDFKGLCAAQEGNEKKVLLRRALLDTQDKYGNTLLHVAAWNGQVEIYDRLVRLGANPQLNNRDGLTPFTLSARFGNWEIFNHIFEHHLTQTVWKFGNIEKKVTDYTWFDWKGIKTFVTRRDVEHCINALIQVYITETEESGFPPDTHDSLRYKRTIVETMVKKWREERECEKLRSEIEEWFEPEPRNGSGRPTSSASGTEAWASGSKSGSTGRALQGGSLPSTGQVDDIDDYFDEYEKNSEKRSAIRMITLFRPEGWYKHTKDKVEHVILNKWAEGYQLVHLGQSLVPYCLLMLIFGLMWWHRQLHVLEHNLWWATPEATRRLADEANFTVMRNPIVVNISELRQFAEASFIGSKPFENGRVPPNVLGPESECGWKGITSSTSGHMQSLQVFYAFFCLFRLAFAQRRIRPSDLDEDEDTTITLNEIVNFIYLNLEPLLHFVLCGLYITMWAARISAGEDCINFYVRIEKNSTAITGLFIFLNLITVCKPYEGIGLLVLTTYQFLANDIFNFLVMYCSLFAGFLLALQTLHNSNRVYLAWIGFVQTVFPQVCAVTDDRAYLVDGNMADNANQLYDTSIAMNGCAGVKWSIYDTAYNLLQISFGDGFSDALAQVRRLDYECAGFTPDALSGYILVLWMVVTNTLILNVLIAVMNYSFEEQKKNIHAIWLLDVSYRIMRYERLFPELIARMQIGKAHYSLWRTKFWKQLFMDCCVVIYCLPEAHLWGFPHAIYVWIKRRISMLATCNSAAGDTSRDGYDTVVEGLVGEVEVIVFKTEWKAKNAARIRAGVRPFDISSEAQGLATRMKKVAADAKGDTIKCKLSAVSKLSSVSNEVRGWLQATEAHSDIVRPAADGQDRSQRLEPNRSAKLLLVISLICRLELLQQEFQESCTVSSVQVLAVTSSSSFPPFLPLLLLSHMHHKLTFPYKVVFFLNRSRLTCMKAFHRCTVSLYHYPPLFPPSNISPAHHSTALHLPLQHLPLFALILPFFSRSRTATLMLSPSTRTPLTRTRARAGCRQGQAEVRHPGLGLSDQVIFHGSSFAQLNATGARRGAGAG
jgi:hypothetical protein